MEEDNPKTKAEQGVLDFIPQGFSDWKSLLELDGRFR